MLTEKINLHFFAALAFCSDVIAVGRDCYCPYRVVNVVVRDGFIFLGLANRDIRAFAVFC